MEIKSASPKELLYAIDLAIVSKRKTRHWNWSLTGGNGFQGKCILTWMAEREIKSLERSTGVKEDRSKCLEDNTDD